MRHFYGVLPVFGENEVGLVGFAERRNLGFGGYHLHGVKTIEGVNSFQVKQLSRGGFAGFRQPCFRCSIFQREVRRLGVIAAGSYLIRHVVNIVFPRAGCRFEVDGATLAGDVFGFYIQDALIGFGIHHDDLFVGWLVAPAPGYYHFACRAGCPNAYHRTVVSQRIGVPTVVAVYIFNILSDGIAAKNR